MRLFVLAAASLAMAAAALLSAGGAAQAAGFHGQAAGNLAGAGSLVRKTGRGCGWDYPCAPRPSYGRVTVHKYNQRARTQFNIENYGDVHINYYEGHRRGHGPKYSKPYAHKRYSHKHRPHHNYRVSRCETGYCRHRCGPRCWYRKFKGGYCGHGCDYYGEKVEFEPEYREVKGFRARRYKKDYDDEYNGDEHSRYTYRPHYKKESDSFFCGKDC